MRLGEPLIRLDTVDSTNAELKRLASAGAAPGTVVVATTQTAGYGQRGRTWTSEPGCGLYFSCLLPVPAMPTQLPFVLGIGVRDALRKLSDEVGLKWVNDLVAKRRKLGGMLVELTRHGAVAGVGLNLEPQGGEEAIALSELMGFSPEPDQLLAGLLEGIATRHAQYTREGFEPIRTDWSRASFTLGRAVHVAGEPPITGTAESLGPLGELLLRQADGALVPVISGTVRTADGQYC